MTTPYLTPESTTQAPSVGIVSSECSAWTDSGTVMADAEKVEELIKLRMERRDATREEALAWALEMRRLYSPTNPGLDHFRDSLTGRVVVRHAVSPNPQVTDAQRSVE